MRATITAACGTALTASVLVFASCAGSAPDTVLTNGKIFTSNPAQPWAQALAIRGDRIIAVGDTGTLAAMAGSATRRVDLGGRTVVPGFNDAHQHIGIFPPPVRLKLADDPTIEQFESALNDAAKTVQPGQMIRGTCGQAAWGDPRFTRDWLDALVSKNPVWLSGFTGHGLLLNSASLALVDVAEDAQDPEGGVFVRDAKHRLNGRLEEYAGYLVERRLAVKAGPEVAKGLYQKFVAEAVTYGITTTQLMGDALPIDEMSKRLVEADTPMRWKVYRFPIRDAGGQTMDGRPALPPQPTARIDVRGMKWILDGTPIERLGFMRRPYADAPADRGRMNFTEARLDEFVGWAYGSDDLLLVHAFGDAAIDAYVTAMEHKGLAEVWKNKRPRIEHGDMMSPDLMARVKALGVVVVQNPAHLTFTEAFKVRYGADRLGWMQPLKSLLEAGIPLALGSDGPMNPFLNILWASTHPTRPDQALTREQAVTAYTSGSAYAEFTERDKGQLTAGKLADLAVLSADVFTAPAEQMEGIRSVLTMIGGQVVYQTGAVR